MSENEGNFEGTAVSTLAIGGAAGSILAMACIGAIAMMASIEVDKDGNIKFDEKLFEEMYKTLVGAYISANDSGTPFDLDKALSDYWAGKSKLYKHERDVLSQVTDINSKFDSDIDNFIKIYEENKDMYERISKETGFPPELIGVIHCREGSCDFNTYLHNGQPLGRETDIVPKGRKFYDFEPAAVDALQSEKYKTQVYNINMNSDTTDINTMCAFAEVYNGTGYYDNGRANPYVLSGTNMYEKGKYPSDGRFDPNLVDQQPGAYALITKLREKEGK